MTGSEVIILLKFVSPFITFGVLIYILANVTKTLNFTRRFNKISEDSKKVGTLAHEMSLKYVRGKDVGFDEYGYYASKYVALVDLIHKYQSELRWYNSDKFEKSYYEHVLTMLKIDYDSLQSFKDMRNELKKAEQSINAEYRNRVEWLKRLMLWIS